MYNINTNKIKARIYENGYTIKEISDILNINQQTLTNYLNGRNLNNIKKFLELLYILNLTPKDIKK